MHSIREMEHIAESQPPEDAFMIPGMGYQPVPSAKYVPANDNGLTRPGDPNGCADDLVTTTFGRLEEYGADMTNAAARGPYIGTSTGGKFFPLDPQPVEVDIQHIARSLSMMCRYNGAVRRFYSIAEHSVLIARWLRGQTNARTALYGLLHDSPESYTGFGDVVAPMKPRFPFVGNLEDSIWSKAIAPRFGLEVEIPHIVHVADWRIRGNEVANLAPMEWHKEYNDPLPVPMMYWTPAEAEEEFLNTFEALTS